MFKEDNNEICFPRFTEYPKPNTQQTCIFPHNTSSLLTFHFTIQNKIIEANTQI